MRTLLSLDALRWSLVAGVLLGMVAARWIARAFARRVLLRRDRLLGTPLPETVRRATLGAAGLCAAAAVGAAALPFLDLSGRAATLVERAVEVLAVVGAALLGLALLEVGSATLEARAAGKSDRAERLLVPVTRKLARASILVVALLAVLGVFGVNVAGIVAGLGIGGLVVALAAKDSVENVFGSLTILFDMPFALGDWVRINGVEGRVEEINLRSTRLRTEGETVVLIPNANLVRASVENLGPRLLRRQRIVVPIGHPTPVEATERFLAEMRAWLLAQPYVDPGEGPERVVVEAGEYLEGTLNLVVQCWTRSPDPAAEAAHRGEILLRIERLREECGLLKPGF